MPMIIFTSKDEKSEKRNDHELNFKLAGGGQIMKMLLLEFALKLVLNVSNVRGNSLHMNLFFLFTTK